MKKTVLLVTLCTLYSNHAQAMNSPYDGNDNQNFYISQKTQPTEREQLKNQILKQIQDLKKLRDAIKPLEFITLEYCNDFSDAPLDVKTKRAQKLLIQKQFKNKKQKSKKTKKGHKKFGYYTKLSKRLSRQQWTQQALKDVQEDQPGLINKTNEFKIQKPQPTLEEQITKAKYQKEKREKRKQQRLRQQKRKLKEKIQQQINEQPKKIKTVEQKFIMPRITLTKERKRAIESIDEKIRLLEKEWGQVDNLRESRIGKKRKEVTNLNFSIME